MFNRNKYLYKYLNLETGEVVKTWIDVIRTFYKDYRDFRLIGRWTTMARYEKSNKEIGG